MTSDESARLVLRILAVRGDVSLADFLNSLTFAMAATIVEEGLNVHDVIAVVTAQLRAASTDVIVMQMKAAGRTS